MSGMLGRLLCLALLIPLVALAADPSPDEIAKAIRDLGDSRFAVREKATKFLWSAGKSAEPALIAALKSEDAETVRRAKMLLEKFKWGIFPDTPATAIELIDKYRSGDRSARLESVNKLLRQGSPGLRVLRRLIEMTPDSEDQKDVVEQIGRSTPKIVPEWFVANETRTIEELLEFAATVGDRDAKANYAAFVSQYGRMEVELNRWAKEYNATKSKRAGEILAHLLRAKGDLDSARDVAARIENETIVMELLWQQGRWKELAARLPAAEEFPSLAGTHPGLKLAYYRLSGDTKALDKTLEAMVESLGNADRYLVRQIAESMLLNGKPAEAIELLLDKKRNVAMTFDLLAAQTKYSEAFAFARAVKLDDPEEKFQIDLRRARLLYLTGERDSAIQLFDALAERTLTVPHDSHFVRDLLKLMVRLGLKDRAGEHLLRVMSERTKQRERMDEENYQILDAVFGDDAPMVAVWLRFLRQKLAKESATNVIKRANELLNGKAGGQLDEWVKELTEMARKNPPAWQGATLAIAEAYRKSGNDKKAEEHYREAVKVSTAGNGKRRLADFLLEKKRYSDAATAYEQAWRDQVDDPFLLFMQGHCLRLAGQPKEGNRLIEAAHRIGLASEESRGRFADELDKHNFGDHARRERELAMSLGWYRHWSVGNMLNAMGRDALRHKDYGTAATFFERSLVGALRVNANYIDASAYLMVPQSIAHCRIRASLADGKIDEAIAQARASLAIMPGNIDLVIGMVNELDRRGRKGDSNAIYNGARDLYTKLATEHPGSAFAHNSVAWISANCRRDLDKALVHAKKAVELEPNGAGYIDTLAEVHFRLGDKEKAIEAMKKCLELSPNRVYFRKQLERFRAGDPNSEVPDEGDED